MTTLGRACLAIALAGCGSSSNPPSGQSPDDAPLSTANDSATHAPSDTPASSVDPASDGPAKVTATDVTIPAGGTRTAGATTFVPDSPGPRPLAFISPGFQMGRAQYTSYATHLASWGFTVVLADFTDMGFSPNHQQLADDISVEITWALGQASLGIDPAKIATVGHSLGGKMSLLVAVDDARVKAVVGWDPVDGGQLPTVATLLPNATAKIAMIGETVDNDVTSGCAPANVNFETLYTAAPHAVKMSLVGADHMDWVDDPTCLLCGFCKAGTAPADLARKASKRLDVAWLRLQLLGDTSMQTWVTAPPEVAAGTAMVVDK